MKLFIENPVFGSPLISTENNPAHKVIIIMLNLVMLFKLILLDFFINGRLQSKTAIPTHTAISRRKYVKCQFTMLGLS